MDMKVSEFIVKFLERLGTEYAFGIPGAHIPPDIVMLFTNSRITTHPDKA